MLNSIVGHPQGVWASMYNERAMLSMKKVGIDFRDIRMAVLCQRVVQVRPQQRFQCPADTALPLQRNRVCSL